ncbi:hypothetical protein [Methylobacterium sp. 17Sr1-1]|uniref:hypothetical protein n=1 Tax=Methylobacterium sp. 17Sr1-1 TaxID=2202826 RepID=UPI000D701996|nr:hypothetical protein [Methylobacterium sp. 17Sr1-1]AWN51713.1 hypothetical protein DK412_08440 [Methylobacterium sp. 17Sr1-1]
MLHPPPPPKLPASQPEDPHHAAAHPAQSRGAGPLGLVALALAILAAGLLLEGHPVDASVSPHVAPVEALTRPLPSSETMLRDLAGRD